MRRCSNSECREPISACMGFVKAGDFIEAIAGTRTTDAIRELCAKCGLRADLAVAEEQSESFLKKIGWLP